MDNGPVIKNKLVVTVAGEIFSLFIKLKQIIGKTMSTPAVSEESCIYLVRHAESIANIVRKLLPPAEAVLTDQGRLQAKALGTFLRNETFTMAISSDYPRAMETAQIILDESAYSKDIALQAAEKIREKDFGIYEDGGYDELIDAFDQSGLEYVDWVPEGAETRKDIEERIESFLQGVFKTVDSSKEVQTILAVTHGDLLIHTFKYLTTTPDKFTLKNWKPEYYQMPSNTGYTKIIIEKNPQPLEPRVLRILSCHENLHLKALDSETVNSSDEKVRTWNL